MNYFLIALSKSGIEASQLTEKPTRLTQLPILKRKKK